MSSSEIEVGDEVEIVKRYEGTTTLEEGEVYVVKERPTVQGDTLSGVYLKDSGLEGWISTNHAEKIEQEDNYKPNFVEVDCRIPQDLYELIGAIAYEHSLEAETLINYCLVDSILHNEENDY